MSKKFSVSTKTETETGDLWESRPIEYNTAYMLLIHNGWTSNEAEHDLSGCPDNWIPVNDWTQIS